MKKVLFLINTLSGGGAERVLVDTVNSLDQNKYHITVQTIFNKGIYKDSLKNGVVYKTIYPDKDGLIPKLLIKALIKCVPESVLYTMFVRDNYDYEIAFLEGLPTKIISKSTEKKAKKIAWVHTDLIAFPNSRYAFGTEKKEGDAYKKFDRVICVSEAVKEKFICKYDCPSSKVKVLYNILNADGIRRASEEQVELPTDIKPCFMSVGRLTIQKGYDRLLRIHKKLLDEGYMHSLIILGDGPARRELERSIKEEKLEKTAFLLGFDNNPYKYMRQANLFICSSVAEGFSTVVSESVLVGVPVVSTEVAGVYEPLNAPRCSVVVENNEAALYEALRAILKNPKVINEFRATMTNKQEFWKKENLVSTFEKTVFFED